MKSNRTGRYAMVGQAERDRSAFDTLSKIKS
jgi:hypothetical protein